MTGTTTKGTGWPLALALLALAGCSSAEPEAFPEPPQPKPQVSEVTASLNLALTARGGLDAAARSQAAAFLDAYRDGGRGPLLAVVTAPDRAALNGASAALRDLAVRRGLPAGALVVSAGVGAPAAAALRYTDFAATPPGCTPEIVYSSKRRNQLADSFACATESNIAAMVAHPGDLVAPTAASAADGVRVGRAVDLYHQGKATQAEVNRNDNLEASTVKAGGSSQ